MKPILCSVLIALAMTIGCQKPVPPPVNYPPDFESMDRSVQEQYEQMRENLASALEDGAARKMLALRVGEIGMWHHAYRSHAAALEFYRWSSLQDSENSKWQYLLGLGLLSLGKHDEAGRAFSEAIRLEPSYGAALVRYAEAAIATGADAFQVEGELAKALEIDPENVRAWVVLGRELRRSGDLEGATESLTQALALQDSDEIRYQLGLVYRDQGADEQANRLMIRRSHDRKSSTLRMEDPYAQEVAALNIGYVETMRRARLAMQEGRLSLALNLFRQSTDIRPQELEPRLGIVRVLQTTGRTQRARVEVTRLAEDFPDRPVVLLLRGHIEETIRPGTGEVFFEESLELKPDFTPALHTMARRAERNEDSIAALEYYRRARISAPDNFESCHGHLRALIELNRREEAKQALSEDLSRVKETDRLRLAAEELGLFE